MPNLAKAYIAMIAAIAAGVLALVASRWNPQNLKDFVLFFALAMLASALKIQLPGFKTTVSMNFVSIMIGIAWFSFAETVLIGLGGALVQSLWKAQTRPKLVQVFFNAACLTVCTAAAFWTSHKVPALLGLYSIAAMMVFGASVYMVLNTGLVSMVISLAERRPAREIWSSCYEWTFPYFVMGAAVAGLASAASHGANVGATLLVLPAMYLLHMYYRMRIMRAALQAISIASRENEAALISVSSSR